MLELVCLVVAELALTLLLPLDCLDKALEPTEVINLPTPS